MSLRARLTAELPTRTITLAPAVEGADPDEVTVRALPSEEWDALVQMHPPTDEQAKAGWLRDETTFQPALLAECVVSPADEEPLSAGDWAQLLRRLPVGDRERLWDAALAVNENRWESIAELGKG